MIVTQQLELRASERMTDADDGGGEMGAVIDRNAVNTVFEPISEADRTTGRTSLRQIYVHVNSEDDNKLLGANVIISKPPTDPAVNIALFLPGRVGEERTDAQKTIENFLAAGGRSHWHPMGSLRAGQSQILVYQKKRTAVGWTFNIPQVGDVLILSVETGEFAGVSQAICIQSLYFYRDTITYLTTSAPLEMEVMVFALTLKQPLAMDFPGADPSPLYPGDTWLRTTVPAASARFHGICKLNSDAAINDAQINVADLYQPIIATSILESNVNDANLALQSDAVTPYSSYQEVTVTRRSTMWTTILDPLPLAGSVRVGFRAGGKWYMLTDAGGVLQGSYLSDGSGTVNYTTGSVALQAGANPDIGSFVIWQWDSIVQDSIQSIPLDLFYGHAIHHDIPTAVPTFDGLEAWIELATKACFSKYELVPGTLKLKLMPGDAYSLVDRFGDGKIYLISTADNISIGEVGYVFYPEKIVTVCDIPVVNIVIEGGQLRTATTLANNCTATLATSITTQQLSFAKTVQSLAITYTIDGAAKTITTQDWNAYTNAEIANISLNTNGNAHTVMTEWDKWPDIGTNIVTIIAEASSVAPNTTAVTSVIPTSNYNLTITYTNGAGTRTETITNCSNTTDFSKTTGFAYTDIASVTCTYGASAQFVIVWDVEPIDGSSVQLALSINNAYAQCTLASPDSDYQLRVKYNYNSAERIDDFAVTVNGVCTCSFYTPIQNITVNKNGANTTYVVVFESGIQIATVTFTTIVEKPKYSYQFTTSDPLYSTGFDIYLYWHSAEERSYYKAFDNHGPINFTTGSIIYATGRLGSVISSYSSPVTINITVTDNGDNTMTINIVLYDDAIVHHQPEIRVKILGYQSTAGEDVYPNLGSDLTISYDAIENSDTVTVANAITNNATYNHVAPSPVDSATNTLVATAITIDLTPDKAILPTSLRFTWGNKTYGDPNTNAKIYAINLLGNPTIEVGTINYTTNKITITDATAYANANPTVTSCRSNNDEATNVFSSITKYIGRVTDSIVPNSLIIAVENAIGTIEYTINADTNGTLKDTNSYDWGNVLHEMGIVKLEPEQSIAINPATIKATYTAQRTIPLSATELGLDPVRLPANGKVAMLNVGDRAVVHQTYKHTLSTPVANSVVTLPYTKLARVAIVDSQGRYLPDTVITYGAYETYTNQAGYMWWEIKDGKVWVPSETDLNAGKIQFAATLTLTDYVAPFTVLCVKEDVAMVTDTDISGLVQLNAKLTHAYTSDTTVATDGAYVSSQLWLGDLWARYENLFTLQSWTGQWSNADSGNSISAAYDDINFPIVVTNAGVIEERWRVTIISVTNPNTSNEVAKYEVVGERIGTIGYGTTTTDFVINNPATEAPYFTIYANGWKTGWAVGNTVRFNTVYKNNFWAAKCVTSSVADSNYDDFKITVRGDTAIV